MPKCNGCDKNVRKDRLKLVEVDGEKKALCPTCRKENKEGSGRADVRRLFAIPGGAGGKKVGHDVTYSYSGDGFEVHIKLGEKTGAIRLDVGPVKLAVELDWDQLKAVING